MYEFDQREDALVAVDTGDCGNLATRLVHSIDEGSGARALCRIDRAHSRILPQSEVVVLSPALDFVPPPRPGVRPGADRPRSANVSKAAEEIAFGVGPEERVLNSENEAQFADLVRLAAAVRHKDGPKNHALWRMHPERWLESLVCRKHRGARRTAASRFVYAQVPAFAAADRAMIDILAELAKARLAVIELKADEDIHLPLQGLDYWSRVAWHQSRGEFAQFGYFPGREISPQKPLLMLVAPALHVHPTTDTILRYLSPEIDWEVLGIDEHWREEIRVVFRKRPPRSPVQAA